MVHSRIWLRSTNYSPLALQKLLISVGGGKNLRQVVNWGKLRELLGDNVSDDEPEVYDFTWVGKRAAQREAMAPIRKTLRPCPEESVNWDTTQNLYIEGDNLEVLKLLQNSYMGKVKMIYIDPPYNTGNDFVYHDDFSQSNDEYDLANQDENGNKFFKNTEASTKGRFHSSWCSMIYSRIIIARSLLKEDGVIFISIDDNEIENLRKICDEVFGESNFVGQFVWRGGRRNLAKYVSTSHEYMLCFGKNLYYISEKGISWNEKKKGLEDIYKKAEEFVRENGNDYNLASECLKAWYRSLPEDNPSKDSSHYCWIDKKGVYFASDISRGGGGGPRWEIVNPKTGNVVQTPSRGWSYAKKEDMLRDIELGLVHFNGDGVPCKKRYLKENETQVLETIFYKDRRGSSKRLRTLMGGDYFPFPKDEEVILHYLDSFTDDNAIVMDFFSGSASTAHAVMNLNSIDNGNRQFIMVQWPEECAEDSEAYKAGYKNICEIGKERIRRAGKKILEEQKAKQGDLFKGEQKPLDIGFRVFKCDESNYKNVAFAPKDFNQEELDMFVDNIKEDRTDLDLLFDCMLRWGITLDLPMTKIKVDGCTIHNVNEGGLVACFDGVITEKVIDAIAEMYPAKIVFRDSSFEEAAQKMNLFELFKQKCNWTEQEVKNNVRVI